MGDRSRVDISSLDHRLTYVWDGELDRDGEEAALQALSRMINNQEYSDLVIVCKNGVRKYGSRLWVSARCAELERHIMNGTVTESGLAMISLPNTGPAAMLIILEYLHTGLPGGILQRLEPKTLRIISTDVVNAARQLHLPRLENYVMMLESGVSRLDLAYDPDEEDTEKEMIFGALSRMLKNPRYSDVIIESKDGVRIPVSRLWLSARCPKLGRMFTNCTGSDGNVQRPKEKVSLNLSTEVVFVVLKYLYSGSPRLYMRRMEERKRWSTGLEAVCAARYLNIPQLENFLWSLLTFDVSRSTLTSENTDIELSVFRLSQLRSFPFGFLSGSVVNTEEHARNVKLLAIALVRVIDRGWMDTDCIRHLNRQDFTFFLGKTCRRRYAAKEGETPYKLEEYLRLRSIIKWCVWEQSRTIYMQPELATKLVSIFFSKALFTEPLHRLDYSDSEREESHRLLYRQRRRIVQAKTTREILKKVCSIAKFEESFLAFVNLELVHPALLTNLLKPWGLISSSVIQQALQHQALKGLTVSYYVHSADQHTAVC